MHKKFVLGIAAAAMIAGAGYAVAGEDAKCPPTPPASAQLEQIKKLAGRWEGTSDHMAEQGPSVVEYKITSGGSAVVETLFPGTPHEMVSIYHDEGGRLAMTHYCMLGNQPTLKLVKSDGNNFKFTLASGIKSLKEMHMHQLVLTWQDPDHITQTWTSYQDGKPQEPSEFKLARVK